MNEKKKHLVVNPEIHKKLKKKATDDDTTIEETVNKILIKGFKVGKNET